MTSDTNLNFIADVHHAYEGLMNCVPAHEEPSLGGQLLYVGELNSPGSALAVASNIAGGATLSASAQPAALRQALREGTIDFLVNSLDEASRILKNEIRKREPVAVAVSLAPETIEAEMIERGVLPDLVACGGSTSAQALFLSQGAREIPVPNQAAAKLLIWAAPADYAQNLAGFESVLADHLAVTDRLNRRWLRLSPRYLGPGARRLRSIACDGDIASSLIKLLGPSLNT
jgi:hypothetical protein